MKDEDMDAMDGLDAADGLAAEDVVYQRLPVVALVGRPNVGKSRMFNRLVGRREAIVEGTPGVTRDRNMAKAEWYGRAYRLIDTGGFEPEAEDRLLEQMREQAQLAVDEADAILFVVDGVSGLLAGDVLIGQYLRQSGKRVFVLVNKLDTLRRAPESADFHRLGFGDVYAVSAEHGLGIDDFMDVMAAEFPRQDDVERDPGGAIKVAVVGKPNAGKSTLINTLLGEERLLTSDLPGTTRDAIDTLLTRPEGGRYVLIDTAGMRRKRSISLQLEQYSVVQAVRAIERADVVLLLIDAVEGVTDQDAKIAHLAMDRGAAMAILLNKWDLVTDKETNTALAYTQAIQSKLPFCTYAPVLTMSALTRQRTHRILDLVDKLYASARTRVPTPELNRVFQGIVSRHKAPSASGKALRFYYVAQVGVAPPRFTLQLNHPEKLQAAYRRYLENQLRDAFGFEGTPLKLKFRKPSGRRKWDDKAT